MILGMSRESPNQNRGNLIVHTCDWPLLYFSKFIMAHQLVRAQIDGCGILISLSIENNKVRVIKAKCGS